MTPTANYRKAILLTLLVLQLALAWLGATGWIHYQSLAIFKMDFADSLLQQRDYFGSTDWVRWEDGPKGITAVSVHPLVEDNPLLKGDYVLPGDVLREIDYLPVYNAASVRDMLLRSAPGSVFIYQLERSNPSTFQPEQVNLFIESSAAPVFTFVEQKTLWYLLPWMIVPGAFLALASMLIVFPILRKDFKSNWSVFSLLLLALAVFGAHILHHVGLLVSTQYNSPVVEESYLLFMAVLLMLYGCFFLLRATPPGLRKFAILPGLSVLLLLFPMHEALHSGQFWIWRDWFVSAAWVVFFALSAGALVMSMIQNWKNRSRMDKLFHLLSMPLLLVMLAFYILPFFGLGPAPGEPALLPGLGTLFIPLVSAVASQLKFGRVSLVLTQTLEYVLFAASGLVLYFIIHPSLDYLGVQFKYRNFLEVSLLMLGLLLLRALYHTYENRLRRYFISSRQKKQQAMRDFHSTIPSFTSSAALITAVTRELRDYFRTQSVWFWTESDESPVAGMTQLDLETVYQNLVSQEGFWSRSVQLSTLELPDEAEALLQNGGIFLAFPVPIREAQHGLLLLGRRGRQVYNLDDASLIQATLQPTRLTLGVLDLIEREKLLLEKNYEANLTALRSQINPHFLFNTLNTISSLIHDSPNDAEAATEKLAFIFRYTLKHSSRSLVSFTEELSLVRTYLEIEKLRFGARLTVEMHLAPEMEKVEIPAFAIQTFVENCIKHGIAKMIGKGIVKIDVAKEDGFAVCHVEDNGVGINLSLIHSSTGLNNVITRLEQIYQTKNLLYFENTGSGTLVTMKIPLPKNGLHS
jgi:two-component system LytT family sensor kinase